MIKLSLLVNKFQSQKSSENKQKEILRSSQIRDTVKEYIILTTQKKDNIKKVNDYIFHLRPDAENCYIIYNTSYNIKRVKLPYGKTVDGNQVSFSKFSYNQIFFDITVTLFDSKSFVKLYLDSSYCAKKMIVPSSSVICKSGQLNICFATFAPTFIVDRDFIAYLEIPQQFHYIIKEQ